MAGRIIDGIPNHGREVNGTDKDRGQARLEELGYKQELKRDLSVLSNFAFSFAIISILTGVTTLYNTGLNYGGPISMIYGWLFAGFFNCFVALSMGEICSAFPTSGGLYYWRYALSGPRWGPFASWMTGWFNLVGQLFPELSKVVFLDDDVVVQRDLGPLFDEDMHGKVNGAVETCRGEDPWVMSKTFRNYFNFSHPLIANAFNKDQCAWAYGMNIFDLDEWRKTEITKIYHRWQKLV